ncbi:MAG: HAD hydrolase-like protein [Verrucomicrobia bacterium]|nr:HAD hydrolase-like protein [Verrucomicrobiota bacterium]
MTRPRYRHLIWDWNGTLLDDLDYTIGVMNALLARRRLPLLHRERYHAVFDFPVRTYYGRLGFDPLADPFEKVSTEFITDYDARRTEPPLHAAAASTLAAVRATGARQSILSAYRHETLLEIVAHFGLTGLFDHIAGLDNHHAHSKVALGRDLVARLAVAPADILLIGDTLHDLEVARELGVDCALVAAGHHPAERLRAGGAPVFSDLGAFASAYGFRPA